MINNELKEYVKEIFAVDYDIWIKEDPENFVVRYKNSLALFEKISDRVYRGHYAFKTARGKKAVEHGTKILNIVFNNKGVEAVVGMVPEGRKHVEVMSRLLKFKYQETFNTPKGSVRMYCLTKKAHKDGLLKKQI